MGNHVYILILSFLSACRQIVALTDCCRVTRNERASHITCLGCGLQDVPQDLPITTNILSLRNNSIGTLHRNSLIYLPQLEELTLAKNGLYNISPGAFDVLENLKYLDLSENYLEHTAFDSSVFKHLLQIRYLDLHYNNFYVEKVYPENAISCIRSLQTLHIDIFEGFTFGKGFLSLTQLSQLYVYHTGGESVTIRNTSFKGLENSQTSHLKFDFRMKKIEADSFSPFGRLVSLELDSKKTMTIQEVLLALYGLRGRNMESIKLTTNHIFYSGNGYLEKSHLIFLGTICVKKLNLTRNLISGITMDAVLSWTNRSCLEVLDLSTNSIQSPQLLLLLVFFPSLTHLYSSYELSLFTGKRRSLMLEERTVFLPKSLLYIYLSHNPFGGSLTNVTISKNNNLKVLDVSYPLGGSMCSNGYVKGLVHLKEFYMSGLECSNPNSQIFAAFPQLSHLEAKECSLGGTLSTDANSLFTGLHNLSFIDLSFNNIKSLNLKAFKDQAYSLKTLNLRGNDMNDISLETLKFLYVLETLDLSNNLISTLSDAERFFLDTYRYNSKQIKIKLSGNPLVCSCDNLDVLSWLQTTHALYDRENISCNAPEGKVIKIEEFFQSFDQFQDSCVAQFWLLISVTLTMVCFVLGILSRLAWRHSVWLRVRCREPLEPDKYLYDIFISYCDEDSNWVAKTFAPWLDENGIEYCVDEKNFNPGLDIAENIMDAIDNSKQTVFVVSYAFLEREWPMFTMKLASAYSFRDGREDMNIIILLNDMKRSEFPRLIRKNWDIIRPLKWANESNTDQNKIITTRQLFWKKVFKRFQRGKGRFLPAHVSESAV